MPESNNGPTGREWGEVASRVEAISDDIEEIRHRARGDRQVSVDLSERLQALEIVRLQALEREIMLVRHEGQTIATRIYTTISVVAVVASLLGFAVTVIAPWLRPAA